MHHTTKTRLFAVLLAVTFIFHSFAHVSANTTVLQKTQPEEINPIINKAVVYLDTQMNEDGGIRWMDEESSIAVTLRVVMALAAGGYSQDRLVSSTGNRPIDFLQANSIEWVYQSDQTEPGFSVARAGQLLAAIAAADKNPRAFGEPRLDLVYEINRYLDPITGVYGNSTSENVLDQVWAILGLSANYYSIPQVAADWLASAQLEDGSWNDGFGSYLDTTPLAVMALITSGYRTSDSPEIQSALEFLHKQQTTSGGWQTPWDTTTNPVTTALILQAITSAGLHPEDEIWQSADGSPRSAVISLQQDSGVIGTEFANAYSTAEAIIGLSGNPLYHLGYVRKINLAFDYLVKEQQSSGGWQSVGQTLDIIMAMRSAGWDPKTVTKDESSPLDELSKTLPDYLASGPDAIGKAILGLSAAGVDPHNFEGIDLAEQLLRAFDKTNAAFGDPANTWHQSLAILGLHAIDEEIPQGAVEQLIDLQQNNGGWEYAPGMGTWPDTTALVLQALKAGGVNSEDPAIQNGFAYIKSMQSVDGSWGDSSTTAYVIMALNAFDQPLSDWTSADGKSPLSALFSYQKLDGAFYFNRDFPEDNLMSTSTGMIGALGGHLLEKYPKTSKRLLAGIIIDPGDEIPQAACVELTDESTSGMNLLEQSGFPFDSQSGFMNSILDIRNPSGGTMYWSYWQWDGREWQFMTLGAGDSKVIPGTIDAWHFTSWEVFPSLPPDVIPNLNEICGENLLKNYPSQPYMSYDDLFSSTNTESWIPVVTAQESETTIEETPISTSTAAPITQTPVANQPPRSPLPLFLIGGLGVLLAGIILLAILKRHK